MHNSQHTKKQLLSPSRLLELNLPVRCAIIVCAIKITVFMQMFKMNSFFCVVQVLTRVGLFIHA